VVSRADGRLGGTRQRTWTRQHIPHPLARDIGLPAVESTNNLCLQTVGFSGVFRLGHFLCQFAQLLRRETADFPGFSDKIDDPVLFRTGQAFNLINDFHGCHVGSVHDGAFQCKPGTTEFYYFLKIMVVLMNNYAIV
jgi:hypothetical protein